MRAMLDPKRDLRGATPGALARALFRPLRPRPTGKPVVRREASVQEASSHQSRNGGSHLVEGS